MKYISKSDIDTNNIAKKLASKLKGGEVICLYGDLGAGKTVFAKGLIQYFIPNQRILSPTFIIVRHYQTHKRSIKNIMHADLYRIEKEKDLESTGLMECINQTENIVIIEWAERMGELLPKNRIDVKLSIKGENKRSIEINSRY